MDCSIHAGTSKGCDPVTENGKRKSSGNGESNITRPQVHIFTNVLPVSNTQVQTQQALGQRIRELRLKKGWSQESLAHGCGIRPSQLDEIERGEHDITITALVNVAQRLETTVSILLEGIA